ncbi:AMP-binding protein [Actinomadura macrotermitis]|uniref:2-succinylbenzoate--CoA ligase n=1 Tax=Actinomadura macrotermitis TaxID=2585200 RepID=A0A7K0BRC0_9ACTN|nr:AMP-binding protein [Actinomadura macrotermitis]MQY03730.1 2-succinylbenzoate--CoA ligase [Actinomadura macrotermitis]
MHVNGLLDWVHDPVPGRLLRFLQDDGSWTEYSYTGLAGRVRGLAARLTDAGLDRDDTVVIAHRTGPDFVVSFFGVLLAGGTVSPLAPPVALGTAASWRAHAAHVIGTAGARFALADADLADETAAAAADAANAADAAGTACQVLVPDDREEGPAQALPPARTALLQFTSGSRGPTRGVRVSWANLEANLAMIHEWIGGGSESGASWLPLYHDMGLVGGLLVPVVYQMNQGLTRPEQFIMTPLRWLERFGRHGGEIMVMPNFGFDFVVRRVRPEALEGMDFSSVRVVITGAERIRPASLQAFAALLRPHGFDPRTLQPAYGLAEATLAVSGNGLGEAPRVVAVAPGPLRIGDTVVPVHTGTLDDFAAHPGQADGADGGGLLWHVGCGRPLSGTTVEIVDDLGQALPEGRVGEIAVAGPAIAQGYAREDRDASTRFEDGRLLTSDAGFFLDGELYVLGRIGDSLQVRGRNIYVEDLEQALAEEGLFSWHRMAVLAGFAGDVPTVCVVSEVAADSAAVLAVLQPIVGAEVDVRVVRVPKRGIEMTSSGKPRRRLMWQRLLAGELGGEPAVEAGPGGEAEPEAALAAGEGR